MTASKGMTTGLANGPRCGSTARSGFPCCTLSKEELSMNWRSGGSWPYAIALMLVMSTPSRAELIYTTEDLGGGLFQYNFTLINQGFINPITEFPEPISGLNFKHANTD